MLFVDPLASARFCGGGTSTATAREEPTGAALSNLPYMCLAHTTVTAYMWGEEGNC